MLNRIDNFDLNWDGVTDDREKEVFRVLNNNNDKNQGVLDADDFAPTRQELAARGITVEQYLDAAHALNEAARDAATIARRSSNADVKTVAMYRTQIGSHLVQGLVHPGEDATLRSPRRARLQDSSLYNFVNVLWQQEQYGLAVQATESLIAEGRLNGLDKDPDFADNWRGNVQMCREVGAGNCDGDNDDDGGQVR